MYNSKKGYRITRMMVRQATRLETTSTSWFEITDAMPLLDLSPCMVTRKGKNLSMRSSLESLPARAPSLLARVARRSKNVFDELDDDELAEMSCASVFDEPRVVQVQSNIMETVPRMSIQKKKLPGYFASVRESATTSKLNSNSKQVTTISMTVLSLKPHMTQMSGKKRARNNAKNIVDTINFDFIKARRWSPHQLWYHELCTIAAATDCLPFAFAA
jgi:hypothetical protein